MTVCRNPCESSYFSQSPVVERVIDDFSKSLIDEYSSMTGFTNENDKKFYTDNNIPKLKSYIFLLKEFGLDSYTFYNISKVLFNLS